jgi:hypothetical protein
VTLGGGSGETDGGAGDGGGVVGDGGGSGGGALSSTSAFADARDVTASSAHTATAARARE